MSNPLHWHQRGLETSHIEHGDGADWRAGPLAPLHRQADESEAAPAQQRFQIAQALDVGDVEVETRLVNQRVHPALGSGPHRVDAEMHDALPGQPFGGRDIHAGIVGRIFLARERAFVVAGAEQNGPALRHPTPAFFTACSRSEGAISARGAMWRRSIQIPGTMHFSSGYSLIGRPVLPKCRGASMWVPAWSAIEINIDARPCTLPDLANDSSCVFQTPWMVGRMTRIARGAMIELTAEIDDLQDWFSLKPRISPMAFEPG